MSIAARQARRPDISRAAAAAARRGLALLLGFLLVLAAGATARAYTFPELTGRVVDAAGVLDPAARAALEAKLAAQEQKTSDQVVVATVPSLEGGAVEDYANALFRAWRLGQADKNNGVLLLVAPKEHEVRIEVGYGLEGILTDAVSGTIIRNAIVPAFKAGDMADGIARGTDAIIEVLNLDPEEARARARAAEEEMTLEDWLGLLVVALVVAVWLYILWRGISGSGGGGSSGRRRSRGSSSSFDWGGGPGGSSGWSGGGGSSGGGGASGRW
ncbi:TPM domain-containing protein [Xanthobacter albus]|uniref:TPM domain-containing protein n=1 Tax=Xanthobacter albus TaxID=3119929 RepID=UPI004040A0BB